MLFLVLLNEIDASDKDLGQIASARVKSKSDLQGARDVRLSHPQLTDILLKIGGSACAMGAVGGITGMLAGSLAPGMLTGLYALDGPEPRPTFSPVIWGSTSLCWAVERILGDVICFA